MSSAPLSRWAASITGAALALLASLPACSSAARAPEPTPQGVANRQAPPPQEQDLGWAVLVTADREVKALEMVRDRTADLFVRQAIQGQIDAILKDSNELIDEMTIGDGRVHDRQIRLESANLQRAMGAGVATEKQGIGP